MQFFFAFFLLYRGLQFDTFVLAELMVMFVHSNSKITLLCHFQKKFFSKKNFSENINLLNCTNKLNIAKNIKC